LYRDAFVRAPLPSLVPAQPPPRLWLPTRMWLATPDDLSDMAWDDPLASLSLGRACPNLACLGGAKIYDNGHHTALNNKQERLCLACGTRWTQDRVLFSFDRVAGYSDVKAAANAGRLISTRGRVDAACGEAFRAGRKIVRTRIFKAADVPGALVYLSRRAGLAELVEQWCDVQRAA
jgi:hypothetical protein